ncbi:unnamed protein product [Auanema sp. JU1783]|nr:unnamed protein product [Auanema sp. JU1783]
MAPRYHSPQAVSLRSTFKVLRTYYTRKYIASHPDTRVFIDETTFHHVEELDELLHHDLVRGNRDPKTWIPFFMMTE